MMAQYPGGSTMITALDASDKSGSRAELGGAQWMESRISANSAGSSSVHSASTHEFNSLHSQRLLREKELSTLQSTLQLLSQHPTQPAPHLSSLYEASQSRQKEL